VNQWDCQDPVLLHCDNSKSRADATALLCPCSGLLKCKKPLLVFKLIFCFGSHSLVYFGFYVLPCTSFAERNGAGRPQIPRSRSLCSLAASPEYFFRHLSECKLSLRAGTPIIGSCGTILFAALLRRNTHSNTNLLALSGTTKYLVMYLVMYSAAPAIMLHVKYPHSLQSPSFQNPGILQFPLPVVTHLYVKIRWHRPILFAYRHRNVFGCHVYGYCRPHI